ncbi:MAG: vWA domain-containing protein, partial [Planctomycetota bacterium]
MTPTPEARLAVTGAGKVCTRFEWAGWPEGAAGLVAVIVAAAVIWAVIAIYRRERAATAERLRWACCALRILCLGLLGVILLRPSVARDVERELSGRVLLLADRSASMSVRDVHVANDVAGKWDAALDLSPGESVTDLSRHDVLRRLLTRDRAALIRSISRTSQVEVVTFADEAWAMLKVPRRRAEENSPEPDAEAAMVPDWRPTGGATDLGGALRGALEASQAERLAGIIVLSDGRDTEGSDLQAVAREAIRRAVPVHFIGIGSPVAPRNVAVVEVFCSDHAVRGLPFEMRAFVRSSGYVGRSADLVLTATDPESGRSEEVLRRQVVFGDAGGRESLDLRHVPTVTGRLRYTARVEPLEGESRTDDNSAEVEVRVTEEQIHVFLAAGAPSREYRFLAALIGRDPAFDLTASLHGATAGGAASAALPRQREELLAYDVIVLCDPSPDGAPAEWLAAVAGAVDTEGLGFAFLAGPTYTPELLTDPALDRVRALLPVTVDPTPVRALIGGTGYFTEARPVRLGDGGRGHSITNPGPGVDVAGFWREAPGLYWTLPIGKAKPGATVLLLCDDPAVRGGVILAATHSYGLGRAFY